MRTGRRTPRVVVVLAAVAVSLVPAACGTGDSVYDLAPPARPGRPAGTVLVASGADLAATVTRVQDAITKAGGTVTVVVDHAADAKTAGVDLPPSRLVIGGSATAQDPLLRVNQGAGANLPTRYLVRQAAGGAVTITYDSSDYVAAVSGIGNPGVSRVLQTEIDTVAAAGAGVTVLPMAAPLVGVTPTGYLVTTAGRSAVAATVTRITANVDGPSKLVATIDLAAGSATTGPALRDTTELLVSTPAAEAPLIAAAPSFGLEMPMRFVVWDDDKGVTQIAYPDVKVLAARHGLPVADPNVVRLAADADRLAKLAAGSAAQ
ncbi:DUF302 domain-containing protein [Pseudonocardia sp. 73-21]|uniref:DUF302 domain-containing protein n=1 Tax=Pseudonocardia sp. 73-21 TaxID=1895809 RepID=UPI00261AAB06|nr:DUF302 domain-containing protein [Pseudonocardia sp. 73-21]